MSLPMPARLVRWISAEWLLAVLVLAFPVLWWLVPTPPGGLARLVDWKTVAALAGLMILSRGLEVSGLIDRMGRAVLSRLHSERGLAAAMVLFAAALSAVVTNDVALFVTVPLTLGLARVVQLPLGRLIIFQALAVNAGSTASPVGNPQNLFLWQVSGVGFGEFTLAMLPLAAAMMAILLVFVGLGFRKSPLILHEVTAPQDLRRGMMGVSVAAYPLFLLAVNGGHAVAGAMAVVLLYALAFRSVLRGVDVPLLLVFVLMFVNLGLLAQVPVIEGFVGEALGGPGGVMTLGAVLSQGMSNVPAAIFLAQFTEDWRALAWGVGVGGFGFAIGSLANLIALRMGRQPGLWGAFHLWSVPMFGLSLLAAVLLARG